MKLCTCKKYYFLIEKNLPSLSASRLNDLLPTGLITHHPKIRETQRRAFLWVALRGVSFTEDLSEFRQIYLRIQVLVG